MPGQALIERLRWVLHKTGTVELVLQVRVVVALGEITDLADIHHEQDDVRHIDLLGSLDEAGSSDQEPALEHDTRVNERSGVA